MISNKAVRREILRDPVYVQAMKQHGVLSPQVIAVLLTIIIKCQAVVLHKISRQVAA